MGIALSPSQNTSVVETSSLPSTDVKIFQERYLNSGSYLLNIRKRRTNASGISCSSLEHGLHPKPKPKLLKIGYDVVKKEANFEDSRQMKGSSSGLCGQIEKLVLCKRYRDALEMFEILEIECQYDVHVGLVDSGDYMDAFRLFLDMWEDQSEASSRTFATMMRASAGLEMIFPGQQLHACAMKMDVTRLHGYSEEALDLYYEMQDSGVKMDHFTFSMIVRICTRLASLEHAKQAHAGLVRHGFGLDIVANTALVDFYSREGLLDEAFALIRNAPFKPTVNMWAALLTACRIHKNLELGRFAAEKIYGMEPEKLGNYVVLLNIYNSCGKHEEAASVFHTLKKKGLRMLPACTWIDVKKQQHMFISGDKSKSHVQIVRNLKKLMLEIANHGYVPKKNSLLPDVDEREEQLSLYHSEKLAVSYGLLNTTNSTPLHLVQSHRICDDCHLAVKLMTKATGRVIVVRDASRFHRFEDGKCSCVSISCVTFSPNKQPLANIAIHKDVIDNQESAHIIIQPEDVLWVTVGVVSAEPSEGDWVGVFSSAKFK
ncbi:hypothetical protein E3N88_21165 [Mikania micrantha]|uniref:DYW domain-containing protein n=1 Tax=Mikania micrantha TaxID=192012 RepID=A0A5N6NJ61_9ASTR|nr:hypothetical protein E3N88_21165 [Mikania micrantha]